MTTAETQINKPFTFQESGRQMTTVKPWSRDGWYKLDNGRYAYVELATDAVGLVVKGETIPMRPPFALVA